MPWNKDGLEHSVEKKLFSCDLYELVNCFPKKTSACEGMRVRRILQTTSAG